jgi:hypothetical protein
MFTSVASKTRHSLGNAPPRGRLTAASMRQTVILITRAPVDEPVEHRISTDRGLRVDISRTVFAKRATP